MEYLCEVRETDETVVIEPNGKVSYHPHDAQIWGADGLMGGWVQMVHEDKNYEFYLDEDGLNKGLEMNFKMRFSQCEYTGSVPVGKVVRTAKKPKKTKKPCSLSSLVERRERRQSQKTKKVIVSC